MAKKRARDEAQAREIDQPQQQPGGASAADVEARRRAQAEIARRRAAHFANFSEADAGQEGDNVHAGGNTARTLGPWSSAVELVNARQAAAEQRNDRLLASGTQEQQQQEGEQWAPSRDPSLGPRGGGSVAPLLQIALQLLVTHIDAVASLWGVPDAIRSQLAAAVCAQRRMTPEAALLFSQQQPSELLLPDCTSLDAPSMLQLLQLLTAAPASPEGDQPQEQEQQPGQPCRLERLELGFCGRGFADEAAAALASAGPLQQLAVLRLGGAYKLSDAGLLQLLGATPGLQELAVPSASRLTGALLSQLPALAPALRCLDLANCRGLPGPSLTALLPQLVGLRRLVLDGIPEVDAAVLTAAGRCPCLQALSVAMCPGINDDGLTALAALSRPGTSSSSSGLQELVLDECGAVTDAGLLAVIGACRKLRVLSLRRCSRLTDESLAAAAERGTLEQLSLNAVHAAGPRTIKALASRCSNVLQELDVSFCREVPEGLLGQLVDACSNLRLLKVYGCSQLTSRFLHGHSNDALTVLGAHTSCN